MGFKLSSIFKKSKSGSEPVKAASDTETGTGTSEVPKTSPKTAPKMPTQTTIDQSARQSSGKKKAPKKDSEEEAPVSKRTAGTRKTSSAKAPKKDAEEEAPKKKPSSKKTASAPKTPEKGRKEKPAETKKEQVKKDQDTVAGKRPIELKELDRRLKDFAIHSRIVYNPGNMGRIFTEYMAKVFRDTGYKMVLIRDPDTGLISMLDRPKDEDDRAVKDKIIVRCIHIKEGSVTPEIITSAQEDGAFYHADETWCITTNDFTEAAKRRSRKEGAKVKLIDGKKLFRDFLSRFW